MRALRDRVRRTPGARLLGAAAAAVLVGCVVADAGAAGTPALARTLRIGGEVLRRCVSAPVGYCGRISVPLDYSVPGGPRIMIGFRFYPARAGSGISARTVVPVEGGPGLSTIGSVSSGYLPMYGALLRRWNLLAVDNRGTGVSTPLYCGALQQFTGATAGSGFDRAVRTCARKLNHRWRYPDGHWVRASAMFGTIAATNDLAAVIARLRLGKVDLYGDSYGSYFAQVFAGRYPRLVRSVVLDSTYPVKHLDPWYRSTIEAMPTAFDAVCRRAIACRLAARGASWPRLVALAHALEHHPIAARVPGYTGSTALVTMNAVGLVDLLSDAAGDTEIYRELDAAARAYLTSSDPLPLLRLYDQRLAFDEAYFAQSAGEYSVELYLAVACTDYPQLFAMNEPPQVRAVQLTRAERLAAGMFNPFTVAQWLAQDQNTETYTACLDWPATSARQASVLQTPKLPPAVPVLILAGELDTWTPISGARQVLTQVGGHARLIEFANATHVVGEGDTICGSELVRTFVLDPAAISGLDAACARAVPAIHAVGIFPTRLSQIAPLRVTSGAPASREELELAAAAIETAGDAIARSNATGAGSDRGLYGGRAVTSGDGATLTLHGYQLAPAVGVSGTIRLRSAGDGQIASATLTVAARAAGTAVVRARWSTTGSRALATAHARFGDHQVTGVMPAP
ncbi:MAG: alpha/beta fold hydrolase [Solirubrobacteraceae bacterium]